MPYRRVRESKRVRVRARVCDRDKKFPQRAISAQKLADVNPNTFLRQSIPYAGGGGDILTNDRKKEEVKTMPREATEWRYRAII